MRRHMASLLLLMNSFNKTEAAFYHAGYAFHFTSLIYPAYDLNLIVLNFLILYNLKYSVENKYVLKHHLIVLNARWSCCLMI